MTTQQPNINVHVQSGTGEILRIVATILLFGGAGAVAWSVAQGAHAELAASGMTMMIVMMVRLMYARGMVRIPAGSGGDDFTATKSAISQITGEYKKWLAGTSMPALAVISIGYAIAFLLLRAAVSAALGVFSNLYVAGGFAAMVGAIVVFPTLVPSILSSLKRKGVVTDPSVQPQAAPVPAPAPAPQVPVAAPVQHAAPVAPAPKKIVRRVVKKETPNV